MRLGILDLDGPSEFSLALAHLSNSASIVTLYPPGSFSLQISSIYSSRSFLHSLSSPSTLQIATAFGKTRPDVVLCVGPQANLLIPKLKPFFPRIVGMAACIHPKQWRSSYSAASGLIADSYSLQAQLMTAGIRAPIKVIPKTLATVPAFDPAARLLLRRKYKATDQTTVILCKEPLCPKGGQHYLMESFLCATQGLNTQLWVVGNGLYSLPLKLYARALDPDRIKVMPDNMPAAHYLGAADVVASVSHQDSFPLWLIEAQAFGLPVVCEDFGGCGEIVVNGLSGYVANEGNEKFLMDALQHLVKDALTRQQMGENAKRLSFRFDPARQNPELLAFLEKTALSSYI